MLVNYISPDSSLLCGPFAKLESVARIAPALVSALVKRTYKYPNNTLQSRNFEDRQKQLHHAE